MDGRRASQGPGSPPATGRPSRAGASTAAIKANLSQADPHLDDSQLVSGSRRSSQSRRTAQATGPEPAKRSRSERGRVSNHTVRRVDPRTVLKISFLFYLMVLVVFLLVGAILWLVASITGAIHGFDHFVEQLFGYQSFTFAGPQVVLGTLLSGVILVVLGSLVNFVLAIVYNLVSGWIGGVRIEIVEEEPGLDGGVASRSRSGL